MKIKIVFELWPFSPNLDGSAFQAGVREPARGYMCPIFVLVVRAFFPLSKIGLGHLIRSYNSGVRNKTIERSVMHEKKLTMIVPIFFTIETSDSDAGKIKVVLLG